MNEFKLVEGDLDQKTEEVNDAQDQVKLLFAQVDNLRKNQKIENIDEKEMAALRAELVETKH